MGGLITIGALWDPDLVGASVIAALEASKTSERKAWAMGVLNKMQIGRGVWGLSRVLRVIVE